MAVLLSYALTNLNDVKESLGIASSDTSKDNLIIRKINQATLQIESYTDRHFKETIYTNEEYSATQTDQLILKQRPITTTQPFSLSIRDSGLNISNSEVIDTQLYFTDTDSGVIYLNFMARGRWKRYFVTYSAGYATIPEDIAEACAVLAAYYVTYPNGSNAFLQDKQEGQRRLRLTNTSKNFRKLIEELGIDETLDEYSNYPVMFDR